MEKLNRFVKEHPDAAYARFVRAYHFGFLGQKEFDRKEMTKAIGLEDRDRLAVELLKLFGGEPPAQVDNESATAKTSPAANQPTEKPAGGD